MASTHVLNDLHVGRLRPANEMDSGFLKFHVDFDERDIVNQNAWGHDYRTRVGQAPLNVDRGCARTSRFKGIAESGEVFPSVDKFGIGS